MEQSENPDTHEGVKLASSLVALILSPILFVSGLDYVSARVDVSSLRENNVSPARIAAMAVNTIERDKQEGFSRVFTYFGREAVCRGIINRYQKHGGDMKEVDNLLKNYRGVKGFQIFSLEGPLL